MSKRKLSDADSSSKRLSEPKFFENLNFYILQNGMGHKRADTFRDHLIKYGANLINENVDINLEDLNEIKESNEYLDKVKCIVVFDETAFQTWDQIQKALSKKIFFTSFIAKYKNSIDPDDVQVKFIKASWLTQCLKQKRIVDHINYEISPDFLKPIRLNRNKTHTNEDVNYALSLKINKSDIENDTNNDTIDKTLKKFKSCCPKYENYTSDEDSLSSAECLEKFEIKDDKKFDINLLTCAHSSKEAKLNPNKHITDKLEELADIYENTRDKFRANSYQKAVIALKRCKEPIKTKEDAIKIPGVGKAIANKIWEIIETGELKKLESLKKRDDLSSLKLFTNVHGVGPITAQSFIQQGFKTLEDLKQKANLNQQQKIGLKYYHEFLERIPRDEVAEIEKFVKSIATSLDNNVIIEACGSYRRGKASCGDVDILLSHPDGLSHKMIFPRLIEILHEKKFLTDDLVYQDDSTDSQRKYLGVCQLPKPNSLHRRIDIISIPYDEYACALLYFTGSAHFNRSMRLLAKKLGLSLSEKSLSNNVIRKGNVKVNNGQKLKTHTEEDIFKLLNLTYRAPEDRDF